MPKFYFFLLLFCFAFFRMNGQPPKSFGFTFICNGKDSVQVDKVITESPAEKGGLKTGDLLQQVNGVSLLNKTTAEVSRQLAAAPDQSSFTFLRMGKPKQANVLKAPAYTFNRTCLSGDCINGKGVAIGKLSNNILDGVFVNGELIDGSWYVNGTDINKKGMLIRRGQLTSAGERFTGVFIDPKVKEAVRWYEVKNHDVTRYQFTGGMNFNGVVKCYADPDAKKILWRGTFSDGQLVDYFYSYDYEKDLEWSFLYNRGMKMSHSLQQLSTGKKLGDDLHYDERNHSWSGLFKVDNSRSVYLSNMTSYQQIEEQYRKTVQNTPSNSNTSVGNTSPSSQSGGGSFQTEEARAARIRLYERIKTIDGAMAPYLRDCQKDANYGINVMRMSKACKKVSGYCSELISLCNEYLKKYERSTPSEHVKDIKDRISEAARVSSEVDR